MQVISANLAARLTGIDARVTPRTLLDVYEIYPFDYVPGVSGFDPDDAIERFAGEEITWNGNAYRREVISRGDVVKNFGQKTNTVLVTLSNISRYAATWAQTQQIEGLFGVVRTIDPSVTDDSIVLIIGRCEKPSDITKQSFSLSIRQDFGNINQEIPPRQFTADDPEGRSPSDPLYEGFRLTSQGGTFPFPVTTPSTSFFGRLLGKQKHSTDTRQWSSSDNTAFGSVVPMVLGRCQMELIPILFTDAGYNDFGVWVIGEGRIDSFTNVQIRDDKFLLQTQDIHLGDLGGTGTNATNMSSPTGPITQGYLSRTAYTILSFYGSAGDVIDEPPLVTALVRGMQVSLPDGSGVFIVTGWTDNPVYIARFILTDPRLVNIDPAFMEDSVNYLTGLHCDEPLIDDSNSEVILIPAPDIGAVGSAGGPIIRYPSTGIITPRMIGFYKLGFDADIIPEEQEGDYTPYDVGNIPNTFAINSLLRKRYTFSAPITDHTRAVDFLYKTVFPTFKGYLRINKRGKYEIRSEQSSDATMLRSATAVGDTVIPIYDVTPWKSGPDLLTQRILLGFGLTTSEVRNVSSANYSTAGNSVTLSASVSGGVTATASGANLSGGSTSVQASGTVTIGGTPGPGDTATITINGIASVHTLNSDDTTGTVAAMLTARINATPKLNRYISALWDSGTPTVVTIKAKHGVLNLDSALLKAHSAPIADPTPTPSLASSAGALAAGTYKVAYADVTALGQTALSPIAPITLAASKRIDVGALALVGTSRNWYVSDAAGSDYLKYVANTNGSAFSINALPLPGAAIPRGYNATGEEIIRVAMSFATNSQDIYPVWRASIPVLLGEIYLPTVPNGHKYEVTDDGTTGSTEPSWPLGGTPVPIVPTAISGCKLWLKGDDAATGSITTWPDASGQGNDATAFGAPTGVDTVVNGHKIVRLNGTSDYFSLPNLLSGATAGTAFIVVKIDSDPPSNPVQTGHPMGVFGTDNDASHYPYTDGTIYHDFGTTSRKDFNPTPSLASWRVYGVMSASADWRAYLDGTLVFSTGTNTVAFGATPLIGHDSRIAGGNYTYTDGDIAEVIIYNSALTTLRREQVETYLGDKYGITVANYEYVSSDTVTNGTAVFTEAGSTVLAQAGLTRANIVKDTFKWPKGSTQPSINQIKGKYRDSKNDFALTPFTVNAKAHQLQVKKKYPYEVDLSGVDNSHQKDRIANFLLAKMREGDQFMSLETGPQGMVLEEGDVITGSDDGPGLVNEAVRIEELRIKPNHDVEIVQARKYSTLMFADEVGQDIIPVPSTLRFTQTVDSIAEFIDNFAIRDGDGLISGFYIAVSRDLSTIGDWRGWVLYANYGDGYVEIARGDVPAIIGTADTTLASVSDATVFDDTHSVDITLKYGPPAPFAAPFASVTKPELAANSRRNLFLIGDEYVQAATIVDNGDQSYTLSDLLRGRFGTDRQQLTHGASERVVFLDGSEQLVQIDPVRLNTEYNYKVVTTNQDLADATAIPFAWTGGTLKTPSPGNLRGDRDSDGDLLSSWNDRSRIAPGMTPGSDVPIAEERQLFNFKVMLDPATGEDVIRQWQVVTGQAMAAVLNSDSTSSKFDWIAHNTLSGAAYPAIHQAASIQRINQTGNFVQGTLVSAQTDVPESWLGLIPAETEWRRVWAVHGGISTAYDTSYLVSLTYYAGLEVYVHGSLVYTDAAITTEARIHILMSGTEVRFYVNYVGPGSLPFYVSPKIPQFPYRVFASVRGLSSVEKVIMTTNPNPKTVYSTDQQTEDFGSPQNPIRLRVSKVSAIVGEGDYAEAIV